MNCLFVDQLRHYERTSTEKTNKRELCFEGNLVLSTGLIMWIGHRKQIRKLRRTFQALALRRSERRGAKARNVSFRISFRWPIHIINPVDKTKLSCYTSHRRNITVSLETYPLYSYVLKAQKSKFWNLWADFIFGKLFRGKTPKLNTSLWTKKNGVTPPRYNAPEELKRNACEALGFHNGNVKRKQLFVNLMRITRSVEGKH